MSDLTIRDLNRLIETKASEVEDCSSNLKAMADRIIELQSIFKKTQEELNTLQSELKLGKNQLKKDKHKLKNMKKELDSRNKERAKEEYVKRCRSFILDNDELAEYRVHNVNLGYDFKHDTSSLSLPLGSEKEQNAYLDTLSDDTIISFAQLLHLCKGFDEAECEDMVERDEEDYLDYDEDYLDYDGPPTVEKLHEVNIVENFGITIFFSEEYDCNGRQDYECCPKRHAYVLNVSIPSITNLVTFNKHFSIDTVIEESWSTV